MTQYSGVFTLQQQGQALTSGQWCTDPYYKNTTLLLHADGVAGGAQNNTFLDSSTNAFTVTRGGTPTQGSFTPYGPTWSNYFNGSSDYIFAANNAAFQFGSGDFTIEAWVYLTASSGGDKNIVGMFNSGANYGQLSLVIDSSNRLAYYLSSTGSSWNVASGTAGGTLALNAWTHIALVRSGNTFTPYVNGVAGTTVTSSATLASTNGVTSIGVAIATAYVNYFPGYISNARIVKGTAVYTSNFTPSTTPLTAITNTSLLTCQSNRFVDNSSNAFAITVGGTASVQRFSPFAPQYQYTPAVIGGSGFFKGGGSGDTLTLPSITVGTNPFCFECWVYPTTVQNANTPGLFVAASTNGLQCSYYGGGLGIAQKGVAWQVYESTVLPTVGAWNHIAFVRSGTGSNQTSIFLNGVRVANGTVSTNYSASTYAVSIVDGDFTVFYGYIADCRFTNGSTPYDATQSTITIPTAPLTTSASNTTVLLSMTNAGIYDNAMMNNLETVGNAQVSTSVVKYGSGSLAFDGTGDYLQIPASPNLTFGTGSFTVECWFRIAASGTRYNLFGNIGTGDTSFGAYVYTDGTVRSGTYNTNLAVSSGTVGPNIWYHYAFTWDGTTYRQFINGVLDGTSSTAKNLSDSTTVWQVGAIPWTASYLLNGYMDDLRITKGVARYTANFQPPKVAFANQ